MNPRIVLTGPESTGKSALTVYLAKRFSAPFADEYARVYLERHGPAYDYELLLDLSRGHRAWQAGRIPAAAPLGFLDTDLINYKIWCDVAFGRCHAEILEAMEADRHHRYLLCFPDLPWESDPLREHPNDRMMLFDRHRAEIERLGRRYEIITGTGPEREEKAREAVVRLLA